jgi:DNA invertase Pin-like site-specific DNA recombinase
LCVGSMALRVVGYVRVSTEEQQDSGAGLEAQRTQIRTEAARRSWRLIALREDAASGKSLAARDGLQLALRDVESGTADALVVAKLDRLSRSLLDFASLMERSRRRGWALVALDLGVDTTTPQGEMVANVMASFAQFERKLIGQRTREALAVKRLNGIRLGRPPTLSPATVALIRGRRARGMSLAALATQLNAEGRPTAHGGRRWYVSTVQAVLRSRSPARVVERRPRS